MVSLRAAAALPSLEDVSPSCPNSDDERRRAVVLKNDGRNTLKFSFKSNSSKPPLDQSEQEKNVPKISGSNKKHSKKKRNHGNKSVDPDEVFLEKRHEAKSLSSLLGDHTVEGNQERDSFKNDDTRSTEKDLKSSFAKAAANNSEMIPKVKIRGSKAPNLHFKDIGEETTTKSDAGKGTKLVIHLGTRHKSKSGSPKSEMPNSHKERELGSIPGMCLIFCCFSIYIFSLPAVTYLVYMVVTSNLRCNTWNYSSFISFPYLLMPCDLMCRPYA
jgi:hypothetical protein